MIELLWRLAIGFNGCNHKYHTVVISHNVRQNYSLVFVVLFSPTHYSEHTVMRALRAFGDLGNFFFFNFFQNRANLSLTVLVTVRNGKMIVLPLGTVSMTKE